MSDFNVIGKRIPHPDSHLKVTGRAQYSSDLILPGMLTGKILRSTRHHARISHLDTSAAMGVPGVRAQRDQADARCNHFANALQTARKHAPSHALLRPFRCNENTQIKPCADLPQHET